MELKKIIEDRRSIRKFQEKPVEREKINACLEAARLAPSACNSQPWEFVVIDDPKIKEAFCKAAFSGIYAQSKWAADAPAFIVAISDKGNFMTRIGNFVRGTTFYLVDHGIACEHIVLRAWDLGLGTCWMGWINASALAKFLKLPGGKKVEHVIPIGYPAETPQPRPRQPLESIVSYNEYKK